MFERRSETPLWVEVAIGVSIGGVVAGVILYALLEMYWRVSMNAMLRDISSKRPLPSINWNMAPSQPQSSFQAPPTQPIQRPAAVDRTIACPNGYTVGSLNGQPVCVSPGGRVVPAGAQR